MPVCLLDWQQSTSQCLSWKKSAKKLYIKISGQKCTQVKSKKLFDYLRGEVNFIVKSLFYYLSETTKRFFYQLCFIPMKITFIEFLLASTVYCILQYSCSVWHTMCGKLLCLSWSPGVPNLTYHTCIVVRTDVKWHKCYN